MIAHTIDAARASQRLTRAIVSTDDEEIAVVARGLGAEVPFMRPAGLAADDTPMLEVLQDTIRTLREREAYETDILVLLQPTSPLRRADHIDAAVDLLVSSGADSVVSVVAVPHQYTPASLMTIRGGSLVSWQEGPTPSRRQDKPELFARNGPAVIAVRPRVLSEDGTLYGKNTRALVMSREDSLDIDDAFDLAMAELLMARRPA